MNNKTQEFYASFFKDKTKYDEVIVNGFTITQQIHGGTKKPVYCLYTKESYKAYKLFQPRLYEINK